MLALIALSVMCGGVVRWLTMTEYSESVWFIALGHLLALCSHSRTRSTTHSRVVVGEGDIVPLDCPLPDYFLLNCSLWEIFL